MLRPLLAIALGASIGAGATLVPREAFG